MHAAVNIEKALFNLALARLNQGFTQEAYARDISNQRVSKYSGKAVSWSSRGALLRAEHELSPTGASRDVTGRAFNAVSSALNSAMGGGMMGYNDTHQKDAVIALWEVVGRANGWLD